MGKKTAKGWAELHAEKVLSDAERSGLDDREFAKRQGLESQWLWWRRTRLGRPRSETEEAMTFVELRASSPPPTTPHPWMKEVAITRLSGPDGHGAIRLRPMVFHWAGVAE